MRTRRGYDGVHPTRASRPTGDIALTQPRATPPPAEQRGAIYKAELGTVYKAEPGTGWTTRIGSNKPFVTV